MMMIKIICSIGIIIGGVMIAHVTKKHPTPVLTEKYGEHWMLPATAQLFPDGLVPVALTNKYPIVDASGSPDGFIQKDSILMLFRKSLPPPSRLD